MRAIKLTLITLIIAWGLMALMVRSATPFIDDYRPTLEQALSEQLNTAVSIDSIAARWYGLRPLVVLRTLRIGENERQLTIDRASIDIDPVGLLGIFGKNLRDALLQASRLTVEGLALTLVREFDGRIHLEGIGALGSRPSSALPRSLRLVDTRLTWIDRRAKTPPLVVPDVAIAVRRHDRRLELRARLDTPAGSVDAAAQFDGFLGTTDWSGESYLQITDLDVAALFATYLPRYYGLQSLDLNVQAWTRWEGASPVHSQGEFGLRQLRLRPTSAVARALDIAAASAKFSVRKHDNDLLFGLADLHVSAQQNWAADSVALAYRHSEQGVALDLRADYLPLDDLRRIALVRLPWPALRNALEGLEPRGNLRDVRFQFDTMRSTPDWRVDTRIEELALKPWQRLPGIGNQRGSLRGRNGLLQLDIDSVDSTLQLQPMFRDTLELDRLIGAVEATWTADSWTVRTHHLTADTAHLRTESRLRLSQSTDGRRLLDLQTDFRDGDGRHASRYYPVTVMSGKLVDWLDASIQDGGVTGGSALFFGDIADFAFEKTRTGNFEVLFDVVDLDLDYRAGWPPLKDLAARVHFHGNQLDIAAADGRIFDSQVIGIDAHVDSLDPASSLAVRGQLAGPLADTLKTLRSDALRDRFGRFADALSAKGATTLDLDFSIPFNRAGAYRLNGNLQLDKARLDLPDWAFALSQIDGQVGFTLDGIEAQGVRARAMNKPLRLDVRTLGSGKTRVAATTTLNATDVARQFPDLPLHLAEGSAAFVINVDIPPGSSANDAPVLLSVESPLRGMAVGLPAPLGKSAGETRTLKVQLPLGDDRAPGRLDYGNDLSAWFDVDGSSVDIGLGGVEAKRQPAPGIRLTGTLDTLDTVAWQQAFDRLAKGASAVLPPIDVDLRAGRIAFPPLPVDDASIFLQHRDGAWRGNIDATQVRGQFTAAAALSRQPIDIALDRLWVAVPIADEKVAPPPAPDPTAAIDPTRWPGLQLSIADLRINDAALGQLTVDAQPVDDGLRVEKMNLRGGPLTVDGRGAWSRTDEGVRTSLQANMASPALGDLLVDLGYARQLEESPGKIDVSLNWPGDPTQLHASTSSGEMALDIGAGRLAEVDPGVTRVVGLLNLNALTRRLTLDFRDIYKKGYSFDTIQGDFSLADGKAATRNLTVEGPTGRIELDGTADLLNASLNQHVRVTPDLDATLPIAGALAGGPLAGIAVLVAQQVLADSVDDINRFEYAITGPWANPEIAQLESGGTLSKILKPLRAGPGLEAAAEDPRPPLTEPAVSDPPATSPPSDDSAADLDEPKNSSNPLRGLLDLLKSGKTNDGPQPMDRD